MNDNLPEGWHTIPVLFLGSDKGARKHFIVSMSDATDVLAAIVYTESEISVRNSQESDNLPMQGNH